MRQILPAHLALRAGGTSVFPMSQVLQLRHAPERNRIEAAAAAAKPAAVRERQFYFVLLPNFTMIAFAMASACSFQGCNRTEGVI